MACLLGIDPGLRHCGWGVIETTPGGLRFVECGTIHPSPKLTLAERLHWLALELEAVIIRHQPVSAGVEETFVNVNGQSTLKLGQARGAVLLTLARGGMPVAEYASRLVKQSITGSGRADKTQMQRMVQMILPQSDAADADAADALAVAICHAHHVKLPA